MVWWNDALYVGASRQPVCTSFFSIWNYFRITVDQEFADTYLPYPPNEPELSCAPDGSDLALQAEIWRWQPSDNLWQRVFQSPLELDNPGPGAGEPAPVGKKLPYEISFRGMTGHTEPDGTEALYAFGVNSTIMWDNTQLPPPRILRSTDGLNFQPLPQTPGTFLGDLPHNPDHSSFRSPESFNGKLFVISGPVFGQGSLIASADPAQGDDAWHLAAPADMVFYEMEAFNGWLYLGTLDLFNGYSVVKTRAEGTPPYEFVTVIPQGAGLLDEPSRSAVSMREYKGRLYVGTATKTELIRINPDDTWELVMGPPREIVTASGASEWKYPISGLDAGFGHSLNDHAWQMIDVNGSLYIGTYNVSTWFRDDPVHGASLEHNMGAHLYRTDDGWHYSAVTTDAFADPSDPFGGRFDYGFRTMASTPYGTFFGTANDFHGLAIFRAENQPATVADLGDGASTACGCDSSPSEESSGDSGVFLAPPDRLEVESSLAGHALLSWRAPGKTRTRILRAEIHPIRIRDEFNYFNWDLDVENGNFFDDTMVGPYEEIATVEHCSLDVDDQVLTTSREFVTASRLSSADTSVRAGGTVRYRAGDQIVLENGFSVEAGSFEAMIAPVQTFSFIDSTLDPEKSYMYYVVGETCSGASEASNLVTYPLLTPPVTFAQLWTEADRRLQEGVALLAKSQLVTAEELAAECRLDEAIEALEQITDLGLIDVDSSQIPALSGLQSEDYRILVDKLVRRLMLFQRYPALVVSDEICSPGGGVS